MDKFRLSTNIGRDNKISFQINESFNLLEVLSLKLTQKDVYTSLCSDYGVVCGRVSVNNGLGIPNARLSIFIPLSADDEDDPVISALYPYKSVSERNEDGLIYNLLPSRKQHGGHQPTGSFPDQLDILTREEVLEVYEKYYKYTVKTNDAGDFMIWGVPVGTQTLHVDVDLSDIGCFSLRPDDLIRQGKGEDQFKNTYTFKSSTDLKSLPQIISYDKTIDVYPFWGSEDLCEIGITRTDFDLSDQGVKIEPKSYLLGSIFSDQGNNSINKNCTPKGKMGQKCGLTTESVVVEMIRFTTNKDTNNRPILETYEINQDVDDDGSFVIALPMNMDYVFTNEFGENEITNDTNKGIPTSSCYRFRVSTKNNSLGRIRNVASYLVPNIREYSTDIDKSYSFSTNWTDYPTLAVSNDSEKGILYNEFGEYFPRDYFYRFNYNKVYSVSSFLGSYFSSNGISRHTYLGIKEISPKEEDDCENNVVTPPINWGIQKFNFSVLLAIIINTFERIMYYAYVAVVQVLIVPFQFLWSFKIPWPINWRPFGFFDSAVIEPLQRFGTVRLGIAIYPECETCDNLDYENELPPIITDPEDVYNVAVSGTALIDTQVSSCIPDTDDTTTRVYFEIPFSLCPTHTVSPSTMVGVTWSDLVNNPNRFLIKYYSTDPAYVNKFGAVYNIYEDVLTGSTINYLNDNDRLTWSSDNTTPPDPGFTLTYKIFDVNVPINPGGSSAIKSELGGGCKQYVSVYEESIVAGTYCVSDANRPYSGLTTSDIQWTVNCTGGKTGVGQVIRSTDVNSCSTCGTHSGYSEFRYGLFTIIPAASINNWNANFIAIKEYSNRKLVAKLFCEGVSNYSFMDNWLTGALYFFPFKFLIFNTAFIQISKSFFTIIASINK